MNKIKKLLEILKFIIKSISDFLLPKQFRSIHQFAFLLVHIATCSIPVFFYLSKTNEELIRVGCAGGSAVIIYTLLFWMQRPPKIEIKKER